MQEIPGKLPAESDNIGMSNGEHDFSKWIKHPIWLVWSLDVGNTLALREVSTSNSRARLILKTVKNQRRIVRAWIEPREANHLFGHRDVNWGVGDNMLEEQMRKMKPPPPTDPDDPQEQPDGQ